jgi:3-oxoacyl-[acyl-carrier-protein] synthase II
MTSNGRARVVVTGMGAITPLGNDVEQTWQGLLQGCSAIRPITAFDASSLGTRIAGAVQGFDAGRFMDPKEARRLSNFIRYGIAASVQAVQQSGIDFEREDLTRCGVEMGSALGGTELVEEQRLILEARGQRAVNPTLIPAILISSGACAVAIRFGLQGPVSVPVAACATGVVSIGEAYRRLAFGEADVMLAGGTDSVMTPLAIVGFGRLGALSMKNDTPEKSCAPFSADRDGAVIGEGAAVMVLETLEHATARGATILAEIAGYGLTSDGFHLAAPDPEGKGAAAAMRLALSGEGVTADKLSWICAHGTGTQLNDLAETVAIKRLFGADAYRIPASSNKGAMGHMLGAAGAISAAVTVKATQTGIIPPTINYERPDPECDLDYVPNKAREVGVEYALVNAFGFGGQNGSLLIKRWK